MYDSRAEAGFRAGYGFACLVRAGDCRVLFDTGAHGATLLHNLARAGEPITALRAVVLSHPHDDHMGGLAALVEVSPAISVFLPPSFGERYAQRLGRSAARVVTCGDPAEVAPGIATTGEIGGGMREVGLVATGSAGRALVTGCAHPGVAAMLRRARQAFGRIDFVAGGGFRLGDAAAVSALGVRRVAPCHCSTAAAVHECREVFGVGFHAVGAGSRLIFDEEAGMCDFSAERDQHPS